MGGARQIDLVKGAFHWNANQGSSPSPVQIPKSGMEGAELGTVLPRLGSETFLSLGTIQSKPGGSKF